MKFCLSFVVLLAATIVVPVASAKTASSPACGDVVTANVTLTKSLKDCASGLVVGADNVTIDLNGYTIKGLGTAAGVGIDAADHTGITLKNGKVTDFAEGIKLFNVSNSTIEDIVVLRTVTGIRVARTDNGSDSNQILDNKVRESVDGIVLFGTALTRIAGNTLSDLSGYRHLLSRHLHRRCRDRRESLGPEQHRDPALLLRRLGHRQRRQRQ